MNDLSVKEKMDGEDDEQTLRSPLIQKCGEDGRGTSMERVFHGKRVVVEVKRQLWLAGPLISVSLLHQCVDVISLMFVGHLGELALSAASMATSFASVSGFSLLVGMASALDTLCGQSYGAKQYRMLSIHTQKAMFVLLLASIPLAAIWAYTGIILVAMGQEPEMSKEAQVYARFMIPSLFAYGPLQCLIRFLQAQNIVFPIMLSSGIATLLHFPVCWLLVFKSGLGYKGAALANCISCWLNVLFLALYIKFSSTCSKTWTGFSKEALQNVLIFLRLAIPSAVMVCMEWWSLETMLLLSGLLPNPNLETSVLSISLNTAGIVWMIPYGLSEAVSTRVSNELGAGRPQAARLAVLVVLLLAITEGLLVGLLLLLIRNIWGYAYSNEVEVTKYVAAMMPILATYGFLEGLPCVLSGTARGCGWQKFGAFINLGSYYLVGIPVAVLLAFVFHIGGRGLWCGIICALIVQMFSFLIITLSTNWEQEAKNATERVCDPLIAVEKSSAEI